MKGQLNPELKVGDRVMCFHMEGETGVPPGTLGTVVRITRDPFESENDSLINVKWDNGSSLALITSTDAWKLAPQEIQEQVSGSPEYDFFSKNPDIFEYFDWRWFRQYLETIRKSGIINMFGASPLLFSGKEHIDRYYGEGKEDDDNFQEVLDNADESKNKIIQGVVKYMEENNKPLDNMSMVNRYATNFAMKINQLYMTFPLSNN